MISRRATDFQRIIENLIFLEEIFSDRSDAEIPDLPFLELAKSFCLTELEPKIQSETETNK